MLHHLSQDRTVILINDVLQRGGLDYLFSQQSSVRGAHDGLLREEEEYKSDRNLLTDMPIPTNDKRLYFLPNPLAPFSYPFRARDRNRTGLFLAV